MSHNPVKLPNIKAKLPIVQKLAYELRYRLGHTYLDRCGRILSLIERDNPQWLVESGQVNPQDAPLLNVETGSQFRFSSANLSLAWDQAHDDDELTEENLEEFMKQAESLTGLVVDELGINNDQFARIGFRVWYVFAANTCEEAESWLCSLHGCQVSAKWKQAFGGELDSMSLALVLTSEDRRYRLNFSSGERQLRLEVGSRALNYLPRTLSPKQKGVFAGEQHKQDARKQKRQSSPFVAIVDIDAYQEEPLVLDVADFVRSSWEQGYKHLRRACQ